MTPTPEQQAVVDATFDSAFKIIAFAGTGKTSTFVQYAAARPTEQMLYCAFNKSVAEEAKRKFGSNVLPKTVHSLAYAWYMRNGGSGHKLDNLRYFQVAKAFHLDVYRATLVCNTVDTFLNSAAPAIEVAHVPEDKLGRLGDDYENDMADLAKAVWGRMQEDKTGQLSMSHSGYLKLFQLSMPTIYASTILLDEAQDTNPVTLDLLRQQMEYGTKLLLCGDPYQQIYSWRGALDAMDMVEAPTALLTRSFRFGNVVAATANKLLGAFFKPPGLLSGLVEVEDKIVTALPCEEQGTVICRTNAELFRQAAAASKVHVVGEEGFSEFLDTVMQVYFLYSGQREKITLRQLLFFKNFDALMEFAEERLDNELQSKIGLVLAYKDDIPATVFRIRQNLTTAAKAPRILVTGHKAKGLEWDNVELAEDFADLFDKGGKLVQLGEEKDKTHKDEINLLYVALTRAKKRLKLNHQLTRLLSL